MKKSELILAAVAASAMLGIGAASAADLPLKARPYIAAAPVYSWTGFYVGGNVGYGWENKDVGVTTLPSPASFDEIPFALALNTRGVIGGGQFGYNWQFSPRWVGGMEADLSWSGISGQNTRAPIFFQSTGTAMLGSSHLVQEKLDWLSTVRGRLGFLPTDRLMLYGTAGLAFGNVKYTVFQDINPAIAGNQFPGSSDRTKAGWTAGAGFEWAFLNNWSVKGEYLYVDLGNESVIQNQVPVSIYKVVSTFDTKAHIARFGLNYKLN
jgi:outer membrane immunogenic protein